MTINETIGLGIVLRLNEELESNQTYCRNTAPPLERFPRLNEKQLLMQYVVRCAIWYSRQFCTHAAYRHTQKKVVKHQVSFFPTPKVGNFFRNLF